MLRISLGELLRSEHFRDQGNMIVTEAFYDPQNQMLDPKTGKGNLSSTYAYGTQGAEVEVDLETGKVKVLNVVASHDVGKILNKLTLYGQMYGSVVIGLGYALSEEIKLEQRQKFEPELFGLQDLFGSGYGFPNSCRLH